VTALPASLDPAVLAAIGDLALVARVTVDGTLSGLHRSPFHGYSAEFSQYRHYRPGDDLKYVDWKLFARTDRLYTKQYRETANLRAVSLLDASASMGYRGTSGVSKLDYARMLAASLAHLLAGQGDAAGLMMLGGASAPAYVPPRAGQPHLRSVLLALASVEAGGETRAASTLARVLDLLDRRGLLMLLSDLYDEGEDVERELRRATQMGHEVAVFHLLTRDELELPFHGDVEIEDLETGRTVLTDAPAEAAAYRRRIAAFLDRWAARCARYGIAYTRVVTDVPLDAALRGYLLRRMERAPA
jgi:uncharacterized protein (DUF58 family)